MSMKKQEKQKDQYVPIASKKTINFLQIFLIIIILYTIINVSIANFFKDYLYHDGFQVFFWCYILPNISLFVIYFIILKRTGSFKLIMKEKRKIDGEDRNLTTEIFFGSDTTALMATKELRPILAQVHGTLIAGSETETRPAIKQFLKISRPRRIFSCGDVISTNLLLSGVMPDIMIMDGKTCREDYETSIPPGYTRVQVKNVTGGITRAAWNVVLEAINSSRKTVIDVIEGEEDLLVIPLVVLSRVGNIVAYGQPPVTDLNPPVPSGAVMIEVTGGKRHLFKEILANFKAVH
ncbi:MAG: DUF359 domain-containing protein [Promethearchaeota archaeon]